MAAKVLDTSVHKMVLRLIYISEGVFNFISRSTRDAMVVMDLDTLETNTLPLTGFTGTQNDGVINLAGFSGLDAEDGSIDLFVTNFRPSIDPYTEQVVPNQAAVGANVTIEIFKKRAGIHELEYSRTMLDPLISTPNRVAVVEGRGVYLTNDHGAHKRGIVSTVSGIWF